MKWSKLFSIQHSLLAVNSLFALSGVVLLSVGIAVLLFYEEFDKLLSQRFYSLPHFVLATAVFVFLATPLGVYGAFSENFYVISGYGGVMFVALVFEMSIGIAGYRLQSDTAPEVRRALQLSMLQYGSRSEVTAMWDLMHASFECCGANGPSDWWNAFGGIPVSCCHVDIGQISPMVCELGTATLHTAGCAALVGASVSAQAHAIGVSGVVLCCFQFLLTAATGWIAWRSRYEEVELES